MYNSRKHRFTKREALIADGGVLGSKVGFHCGSALLYPLANAVSARKGSQHGHTWYRRNNEALLTQAVNDDQVEIQTALSQKVTAGYVDQDASPQAAL